MKDSFIKTPLYDILSGEALPKHWLHLCSLLSQGKTDASDLIFFINNYAHQPSWIPFLFESALSHHLYDIASYVLGNLPQSKNEYRSMAFKQLIFPNPITHAPQPNGSNENLIRILIQKVINQKDLTSIKENNLIFFQLDKIQNILQENPQCPEDLKTKRKTSPLTKKSS